MALKVVIGLGNPEPKYDMTRHNAGFRFLDALAIRYGAELKSKTDLQSLLCKVKFDEQEILLVKPLTYMNLSGRAASAVLRWYKADMKNMLVIHDDVSLPLGQMRFQAGGGAGGQHGVESIIECFAGSKNFDRLKVGVGPDPGGALRASYVLSTFPKNEQELLEELINVGLQAVQVWLKEGVAVAMNKFNGVDLRPAVLPENKPKNSQTE